MRKPAPTNKPVIHDEPASHVTSPAWIEWYQRIYDYYDQVGKWTDPYRENFGKIAPTGTARVTGLLAYADGTNWNPAGDGTVGYFRWTGSAWTHVG